MKPKRILYEVEEFADVREAINKAVELYPDNIAFKIKHKTGKEVSYEEITYRQFKEEINYFGTALIDLGYQGKRIAMIGKNRYEWALTYFTVLNGVGITVPLDKGLPEEEIESLLRRSKADVVVFEEAYTEIMKKIKKSSENNLSKFICMDKNTDSEFDFLGDIIQKGKALVENNNDTRYADVVIDPEKMTSILFTSGTTSMSKAAMLSHKNFVSNINDINKIVVFYPTDVNIAFLPFHHTFGSMGLTAMLASGVTNVFCDGIKYIQENLKEYQVSVFVCVPLLLEAMYKKIMAEVERQGKLKVIKIASKVSDVLLKVKIDIRRKIFKQVLDNLGGRLRFVISGAAAIDREVAKGFHDFGILTLQGYGLTETAPILCAENETAQKLGSCGFPIPSVEVKIDNPNEEGIGEIIVNGPQVMLGYYENKEATDEVLKDGWFHTGDLGYIDKDGFVFLTGRKKNVIVLKNGKNIYPEEIELLISALPYVAENMVFGQPKGEDYTLAAKIVYDEEYVKAKFGEISEDELKETIWKDIKSLNKSLPTYKHIKEIIVTSEPMIKTTTSKVKRHEETKNM